MKKSIHLLNLIFKTYLLIILGMSTQTSVVAQKMNANNSLQLKNRIYKVSIITPDSKKITFGYLANLSDSNLFLSQSPLLFSSVKPNDHFSDYSYDHLEKVIIQRKGAAGRGAWQGALIGLGLGVISGLVHGDDPPGFLSFSAGQYALFLGIVGAPAGSLIGAIIGSLSHKKFIIRKSKQKFDSMRVKVFEELYVH